MKIIPAIDLWEGRVVRLFKGNPSLSTVYSGNPLETAKEWKSQGAELLHLVDLGAALNRGENLGIIKSILEEAGIAAEVGGGIRDLEKAEQLISWGARRIIIGTAATDAKFLNQLIRRAGREKIAVAADVIDSRIAVKGWQEKTVCPVLDFIKLLGDTGVKWLIYTDISRDGTLEGVNLAPLEGLASFPEMKIIVSGGVASLEDLEKIKQTAPFVWGVISGKALYEGRIKLQEAARILD